MLDGSSVAEPSAGRSMSGSLGIDPQRLNIKPAGAGAVGGHCGMSYTAYTYKQIYICVYIYMLTPPSTYLDLQIKAQKI